MGRRTLLLIASILVAAVGTALIFLYVRGADDRAQNSAEPVQVVVTKKDIAQGTTVADAFKNTAFELKGVPRGNLPDGYFDGSAGLNELQASGQNAALAGIPANTIVVRSAFGSPGAASATLVAPTKVAISMQLTDPNRVAGLLKPGTVVAVIVTTDPAGANELGVPSPPGTSSELKISTASYLMNDARVISVGSAGQSSGGSGTGESVDNKVIAVEVTPTEALLVRAGEKVGELSLAILGKDAKIQVTLPKQIRPLLPVGSS